MIQPLPMTVIGGYLGAGKTTLINRLLSEPHGLRLTLLVNDFGAINIDADLLASSSEDTIELTNGCVCCTMGADLFMAIGDVLDRPERPDHLIVEASGIANPISIAQAAIAEPDLSYGGIVTVVDGLNFLRSAGDSLIAEQVKAQVTCADYLLVSKVSGLSERLDQCLRGLSDAPLSDLSVLEGVTPIVVGIASTQHREVQPLGHGDFLSWSTSSERHFSKKSLRQALDRLPEGVFRLKGLVRGTDGTGFLVQIVGDQCEVSATSQPEETKLVAIGTRDSFSRQQVDNWWAHSEV